MSTASLHESPLLDQKGSALHVGDRVYVPPRSYGDEDDSLFSRPIISANGEEFLRPSIRGRIVDVIVRPGEAARFGPYLVIQQKEGHDAFVRPFYARKQDGRSDAEKNTAKQAEAAEARRRR